MPSQSASIKSYFSPLPSPARSSQADSNTDNSRAEPASQPNPTQHDQQREAGLSLANTATAFIPGDGFTSTEMTTNASSTGNGTQLPPLTGPFTPPHGVPYKEVMSIKHLTSTSMGEGVRFTGRVLNVYSPSMETTTATTALRRAPKGAVGYVKCTVGDGEGVIVVRVWHMNHNASYPLLRLGSLITVWTTHITPFVATENESAGSFSASSPSSMLRLYTSVFPERERGSHVQIHADGDAENGTRCRKPLSTGSSGVDGVDTGKELMTLAAFASGGYKAADAKVLVCVKSVGVKKKGMFSRKISTHRYVFADLPGHSVTRKDGTTAETATVHLLDHTTASISASLNLWGAASASAATWIPHKTILLLTRPGYRVSKSTSNANSATTSNNKNSGNAPLSLLSPPSDGPSYIWLSLTANTLVEIDPAPLRDATWLRGYAQRLLKKRPLPPSSSYASPSSPSSSTRFQTSPDGASPHPFPPLAAIEAADQRILYTLADIDEFARKAVAERVTKNGVGGARAQQQPPPPEPLQLVGFASVVLTEVNLVKLFRRGALACGRCVKCGGAVYANDVVGRCGWCCSDDDATTTAITSCNRDSGEVEEETDGADPAAVPLDLNPQVLGPVLDETGMVATGRLAMSTQAWEQLFGRSMAELVGEQDVEALRALEARMAWVRVSLVVGWMEGWGVGGADEGGWEGVGRLFVLGVRE
ncbi:hypothetical protein DBV05_g4945 [Lasiodiplodia theobromae]|uniref:Uncharacterized protein n=1 Tax=Lasiodiplodia theobromae TaxID=45133 RepID=A0A5N5DEW9_9PEZI|nr:hypothetical protein DBV05_g4945 [Lasiodiplodia theobromae]